MKLLASRNSFVYVILVISISLSIFIGVVGFIYVKDRSFSHELLAQDLVRITSKQAKNVVQTSHPLARGSRLVVASLEDDDDREQLEPINRIFNEQATIPNNKLTGWKGRHMFHLTTNGRLVEGHILLRTVGFPFQRDPMWTSEQRFAGKLFRFKGGKCYWCPYHDRSPAKCINGTLYGGWYKDDHRGRPSMKRLGHLTLLRLRPHSLTENTHRVFYQVYVRCALYSDAPPFQEGVLRVQNLTNIVQLVNPGDVKTTIKDTSAVCVKGIFGKRFSTNTVVQFVRHYLDNWKMDKVILYEVGGSRGFVLMDMIERIKILHDYYVQGRLITIDIRDAMQRMYGAITTDPVMFSATHGQMMAFTDCMMRAKLEGLEWILNVDYDELLTFGADHPTVSETFTGLVHRQEKQYLAERTTSHYPMSVLQFFRRIPIKGEDSVCEDCREWDQKKVHELHRAKEAYNETLVVSPGKFAVKVNATSPYPLTNACGVHEVASKGTFERGFGSTRTRFVPDTDVYLRHYSCMNRRSENSEYLPRDMPEADDWALI